MLNYTGIRLPENVRRMRRSCSVSMADSPVPMSCDNALVMDSYSLRGRVCNPCIGPIEQPEIGGGDVS